MRSIGRIVAIWSLVLLGCYVLLEILFVYYATRIFPLAALGKSGAGSEILLQYSKRTGYPEDYLALLGDSYAFGQGDWLLEGEHRIRPAYSPAHILHEKLDRDVVSFGMPASDSVRANNVLPDALMRALRNARGREVAEPSVILVYFYEGNDLNDNVEVIDRLIRPVAAEGKHFHDPAYFQHVVLPRLLRENPMMVEADKLDRLDGLFLSSLARHLVQERYEQYRSGKTRAPWKEPKKGHTTQVKVGGQVTYLQNRIQSPALSLTDEQIQDGLYVFAQSLVALRARFPQADIGVVYIPAVITPYEVVSTQIHDYYKDMNRNALREANRIRANSERICHAVQRIASEQQLGFVDTRARLRAAARQEFVHGPIDWNHFNRRGYEILSAELLELVERLDQPHRRVSECRFE